MATKLRRSTRATTSKIVFSEDNSPSYPDGPPANEFERRISLLNEESFSWEGLSGVDDVLVYSLFSSKRRRHGYRAVQTERVFGEEGAAVSAEDGVAIRQVIKENLGEEGEGVRKKEDIRKAAGELVGKFPKIFVREQLGMIEQ